MDLFSDTDPVFLHRDLCAGCYGAGFIKDKGESDQQFCGTSEGNFFFQLCFSADRLFYGRYDGAGAGKYPADHKVCYLYNGADHGNRPVE